MKYRMLVTLIVGMSVGVAHCQQQQVVLDEDGQYVVKGVTWKDAPKIDTTGSTLVSTDDACYVNTKDRIVNCFTQGKTWGPVTFSNIRIIQRSLGTAPGTGPDYIGTLIIEPARGMAGGGKRLDFYQEKFIGGVQ